jgi:amphiphysin
VTALYNYDAQAEIELSFKEGDVITVIRENLDNDPNREWYYGRLGDKEGEFPRNYVK